MSMSYVVKIGLGGHTFIEELGNDPKASFEDQCKIVAACLDSGIRVIDTTYYQERVALGRVLKELGRRDEAHILAWNFFQKAGNTTDVLVKPSPYEAHHIDLMLGELQTDVIDTLVIHVHDDPAVMDQQTSLVREWIAVGKVKRAALGMVRMEDIQQLPIDSPVSCVLAPYNAFRREAEEIFKIARLRGFEVIGLSPFVRGWKLDEIGDDKQHAADILLRWAVSSELVDLVIVSMRKSEWVEANLKTLQHGGLTQEEAAKLDNWVSRFSNS
jgi:aryl-alcohol dehydrogenase-like predicted oxidoreductase